MTTREERNQRMDRILAELASSLMWVQGEDNKTPSIHSTDGDCIAVLPAYIVPVIDVVSDDEAGSIVEAIGDCCSHAASQAFGNGRSMGNGEVIDQVHVLLGIDRIVEALNKSSGR